ncbi:MAG: replicative DNA helicase [Candidatus Acidiferrales bacterium]
MIPATDRALPHNLDAERIALGAVLVGNKSRDLVFDLLRPEDFFLDQHARLFRKLADLRAANKPTDLLTVHDELGRANELEGVGGIGYLASLGDGIPAGLNIETSLRLVKEKGRLRALIHTAAQIEENAYGGEDAAELLDHAIERFSEMARDAEADQDETCGFRDASARLLHNLGTDRGVRIFTDLDELDRLTGGFRAGELVLFTAETGVGKTLFAQQTRRRACRDGHHALYASAEMLAPHLVSRELATEADVEHWKMRRDDRLTAEDWKALTQAASRECNRCRILDGELSLKRIRRVARQMKSRAGLDLAILDYDELIDAPGETEFDQQRNLVRGAKSLAMELPIPVIMISQLRKALQGEDRKRPTLQRLYGSGAKPKHASIVIYVDREFVQDLRGDETAARILVLKSRDGRLRSLDARFNIETLRFEGVPQQVQQAAGGEE